MNAGSDAPRMRKVRTFADDMQRAQGTVPQAAPANTPAVVAPAPNAPATLPEELIRQASREEQESHLVDTKVLNLEEEAGGGTRGTIIRDTRRKHWSLSRALQESVGEWVDVQRKTITNTLNPQQAQPTVAPAQTRAEVIEAARSQSVLAPRDDRRAVVEKLRTLAQDTKRVTGKTPSTVPQTVTAEPHWSSTVPEAPAQAPAPVAVTPTPVARPTRAGTQVEPPQKDAPVAPAPQGVADVAPQVAARTYETLQEDASVPRATIEKVLAARIRAAAPAPKTPTRDIPFTPPTPDRATASVRTYRSDALHDVESNQRSVPQIAAAEAARRTVRPPVMPQPTARPYVIAGVLMILIIAVGGFGIFWHTQRAPETVGTVARIPTFIAIDALTPVQFSENRAELLEALDAAADAAGSGVTQIYPATDPTGERVAVSSGDFMRVLDPRAPGALIRSLEGEMMFGATGSGSPFFILKTSQFDAAFAGMLQWESAMSADLAPIFGEPVNRSFDPSARTGNQTRTAAFRDDVIANTDVRVLVDETGTERILYAFFDARTIVIAADRASLESLLARLR